MQRIVRDQGPERLSLPSYVFVGDAVSLEISGVEGQQIPMPLSLQVDNDRPKPIKRIDHLATMLKREIDRLPVAPILEAEKAGRDRRRKKRRNHWDQRTRKPPQMAPSKN